MISEYAEVYLYLGNPVEIKQHLEIKQHVKIRRLVNSREIVKLGKVLGNDLEIELIWNRKKLKVMERNCLSEMQNLAFKVSHVNLVEGDIYRVGSDYFKIIRLDLQNNLLTYMLNNIEKTSNLEDPLSLQPYFKLKRQGRLYLISRQSSFFQYFPQNHLIPIRSSSKFHLDNPPTKLRIQYSPFFP